MNEEIKAYLLKLQREAKPNAGCSFALPKCIGVVKRARSPINPECIHYLKFFGDGGLISRRVRGHFRDEPLDHDMALSEIDKKVKDILDNSIASSILSGQSLTRSMQTSIKKMRDALDVFFDLRDARDLELLQCCPDEISKTIISLCPTAAKRGASNEGRPRPKRQRKAATVKATAEAAGTETGMTAASSSSNANDVQVDRDGNAKQPKPCKPFTGGWAIMVGLHLKGKALSKSELADLSAEHGLCKEPLVKLQRTVARQGQWYSAWSSCGRLQSVGWVVKKGLRFELTESGQLEAARYAEQRASLQANAEASDLEFRASQSPSPNAFSQARTGAVASSPNASSEAHKRLAFATQSFTSKSSHAPKPIDSSVELLLRSPEDEPTAVRNTLPTSRTGTALYAESGRAENFANATGSLKAKSRALQSLGLGKDKDLFCSDDEGSADELELEALVGFDDDSSVEDEKVEVECDPEIVLEDRSSGSNVFDRRCNFGDEENGPAMEVLVDVTEKPVVRQELSKLLAASAETQLPGIDYAFGHRVGDEWCLGNVLVERKTIHDYIATLITSRGEHQCKIQECIAGVGFRVALILEGVNDLKQHPDQDEILAAAYSSHVDVLTTNSLYDTIEFLSALAAVLSEHDGWTLSGLRVLLQPMYEPNPTLVCELALIAVGVEKIIAKRLVAAFGSFPSLLAQLPSSDGDAEVAVAAVAAASGLTLYQAGKALRLLGLKEAPLSRKRGPRGQSTGMPLWKSGILQDSPTRHLEISEVSVEVGPGVPKAFQKCLRALCSRARDSAELEDGAVRVRCGDREKLFGIVTGLTLEPGRHWLVVSSTCTHDWKQVSRARARAYANHGVMSSVCASFDQAARHVTACAVAFERQVSQSSKFGAERREAQRGMSSVFHLARTAGGALPETVASNLAQKLAYSGCMNVVEVLWKLKEKGPDFLLSLGVKDFSNERAKAVVRLFLSS